MILVGRHFPLDIKKREMDLFSLSGLFVRRKSTKKSHLHPQGNEQAHLPSLLHPAVQKPLWRTQENCSKRKWERDTGLP